MSTPTPRSIFRRHDHVIELPLPAQLTLARATNIRIAIPTDDQAVFGGLSDGDKFILAITVPAIVEVGAVEFPVTLAWSVGGIEVEAPAAPVEIGAVTFPLTLVWAVASIEVDQPDVEIGAVSFPLTLSWGVASIVALNPQEIGAVTYAVTLSWSVGNIEAFMEPTAVVSMALGRRGQVYPSNAAPMSHYRRGQTLPNNIMV